MISFLHITIFYFLRLFTAERTLPIGFINNFTDNVDLARVRADVCFKQPSRRITTLDNTQHEKNFNQCYTARRATCRHGRWTTSIRPRYRNTLSKPEES